MGVAGKDFDAEGELDTRVRTEKGVDEADSDGQSFGLFARRRGWRGCKDRGRSLYL